MQVHLPLLAEFGSEPALEGRGLGGAWDPGNSACETQQHGKHQRRRGEARRAHRAKQCASSQSGTLLGCIETVQVLARDRGLCSVKHPC